MFNIKEINVQHYRGSLMNCAIWENQLKMFWLSLINMKTVLNGRKCLKNTIFHWMSDSLICKIPLFYEPSRRKHQQLNFDAMSHDLGLVHTSFLVIWRVCQLLETTQWFLLPSFVYLMWGGQSFQMLFSQQITHFVYLWKFSFLRSCEALIFLPQRKIGIATNNKFIPRCSAPCLST